MTNRERIDLLRKSSVLSREEMRILLETINEEECEYLYEKARTVREKHYGKDVYLRGLIEFTNYCRNDCLYCGIRKSNRNADRYRLSKEEILSCADAGYDLDFRTFVLQGGEDLSYSDEEICRIVSEIRERHPDCAVTLSIGERSRKSYEKYFAAGADRYLLRHETANAAHYASLHTKGQKLETRLRCLYDLKEIGFQVGVGMMVGSPGQTVEHILDDFQFISEYQPQMVGIGPFIPHRDTPFAKEPAGTLEETLYLLGILRLLCPDVLLPATTALGTISPIGRELGLKAGANVVMPNLSPVGVREKYLLYDGKICTGDEAAECRFCMQRRVESTGLRVAVERGDHPAFRK